MVLLRYLIAAVSYLFCARIMLRTHTTEEITRFLCCSRAAAVRPMRTHLETDLVRRALGAASTRVPWRADCLVQALAAKLWLNAYGVSSQGRFGVREQDGELRAHAWLTAADGVVVSGFHDTSSFHELRSSSRHDGA